MGKDKAKGASKVDPLLKKATGDLDLEVLTEGVEAEGMGEGEAQKDGASLSRSVPVPQISLTSPQYGLKGVTPLVSECDNYIIIGTSGSSVPGTSEVLESPISPSDDHSYWKGFLVYKVNVFILDAIDKAHLETFRHFNVETPTIQLLYLDTIFGYIRSYGHVHVFYLDARVTREFSKGLLQGRHRYLLAREAL
ncbi:hypothetical protein F0562_019720 [Nyssa sinensis]|uniref:Uncharacterized protein n=1 Tax=Nyssa sinensis TaxID=561372 RepID=A0A5J5BQI3_9ASTE|nr:hypothetical protein F0562_019720 [Nyssa sinensis]